MSDQELSLRVVGIDWPNDDRSKSNRRFELSICVPGEPVELRREPRNKHDPRAVAVFTARGTQVGYLSAERAPWIGAKIANGEVWEAVFQELRAHDGVVRVRFGGGTPTLPPISTAAVPRPPPRPRVDDGFEPDPEPSEWGA